MNSVLFEFLGEVTYFINNFQIQKGIITGIKYDSKNRVDTVTVLVDNIKEYTVKLDDTFMNESSIKVYLSNLINKEITRLQNIKEKLDGDDIEIKWILFRH